MLKYQNVRGTNDLYGRDLDKFIKIENTVRLIASKYSFNEIRTPIMEFAGVFERNIGELSDIVNKEMYVFEDRGGDKITLRPEGTAPVVRGLLSNGWTHLLPLKYFYMGAMFRYERPQKGRQRQFHQLGFEYLGTSSYTSDVEVINLSVDILKLLGIKSYKLMINSLGSVASLNNYKEALVKYIVAFKNNLSEDSLRRLEKNPLRILDSKDATDKEIVKNAPKISEYLSNEDRVFFSKVKEGLSMLDIEYVCDTTLVRGLDYYTHSVFEIVTDDLGAQGTLIAGGRYNNLIKQMGGIDAGCFGFAGGMERLALMIDAPAKDKKAIAIVTAEDEFDSYALNLAKKIRDEYCFAASFILGKDISSKLKKVSSDDFFATIIIGKEEYKLKVIKIKDATDFQQVSVIATEVANFLDNKYSRYKIVE